MKNEHVQVIQIVNDSVNRITLTAPTVDGHITNSGLATYKLYDENDRLTAVHTFTGVIRAHWSTDQPQQLPKTRHPA